jgi:hypothetical protein
MVTFIDSLGFRARYVTPADSTSGLLAAACLMSTFYRRFSEEPRNYDGIFRRHRRSRRGRWHLKGC